jgi:hypothetical protein
LLVYKWTATPFGWAMLAGTAAFIAVSLITSPENSARVEGFFDKMRRSTDNEGLPAGAPKLLAADLGTDLLALDLPAWLTRERWRNFFYRYREDLVGLAHSTLSVAALIWVAWAVVQLGR